MPENRDDARAVFAAAQAEESSSKSRALALFDAPARIGAPVGTFRALAQIHAALFGEVCAFAGQCRSVNLEKGGFLFAPAQYLPAALANIDAMPQTDFDEIVAKYVEMNIAHPFREGNGRSMRIWLDGMLRAGVGRVVDWSRIGKADYLAAMRRSPLDDAPLKTLLRAALTAQTDSRAVYARGIEQSFFYEREDG